MKKFGVMIAVFVAILAGPAVAQPLDQATRSEILALYLEAEDDYQAGRYREALQTLDQLNSVNPGPTIASAQDLRVRVTMAMGAWQQATAELNLLLSLNLPREILLQTQDYRSTIDTGRALAPIIELSRQLSDIYEYQYTVSLPNRRGNYIFEGEILFSPTSEGQCQLSLWNKYTQKGTQRGRGVPRDIEQEYRAIQTLGSNDQLRLVYYTRRNDDVGTAVISFLAAGSDSSSPRRKVVSSRYYAKIGSSAPTSRQSDDRTNFEIVPSNTQTPVNIIPADGSNGDTDALQDLLRQGARTCGYELEVVDFR